MKLKRAFQAVELRAEQREDGILRLAGIAAVFNTETVIWDMFREVFRRGAFKKTIKESDQVMLWSHNRDFPMARKSRSTLSLKETEQGVEFEAELGSQTWAKDAYESIRRGDVQGMSFYFEPVKEAWPRNKESEKDKLPLREILEARLLEISPVVFPAYPTTQVEARSILDEARGLGLLQEPEANQSTGEPVVKHHSPAGSNDDLESIQRQEAERARQLRILEWRFRHGL